MLFPEVGRSQMMSHDRDAENSMHGEDAFSRVSCLFIGVYPGTVHRLEDFSPAAFWEEERDWDLKSRQDV
jgi:hypothetical protein